MAKGVNRRSHRTHQSLSGHLVLETTKQTFSTQNRKYRARAKEKHQSHIISDQSVFGERDGRVKSAIMMFVIRVSYRAVGIFYSILKSLFLYQYIIFIFSFKNWFEYSNSKIILCIYKLTTIIQTCIFFV